MPRPVRLTLLLMAVAAMVAGTRMLVASETNPENGLVVHEWGTFTSVAAPNGQSVTWRPLSGPQDLPCFVTEITPQNFPLVKFFAGGDWLKAMSATIRMETPVLYFYSPRDMTVDVDVRFPAGLVTEWFPRATVPAAGAPRAVLGPAPAGGSISWNGVHVTPKAAPAFLTQSAPSHYYAARDTDASPIDVAGQRERFLFYRGIGSFHPPVTARLDERGAIEVSARDEVSTAIVFENRGGRIGYSIETIGASPRAVVRPALNKSADALRADLKQFLVKEGLYPREAAAMVETWRDSWFEEGTRVFYLMPTAAVDRLLPLTVTPAPANVVRAFVGRVEMITPEMQNDVERALVSNDLDTLNRFGRFLEPIAAQVSQRPSLAGKDSEITKALQAVVASHPPRVCH